MNQSGRASGNTSSRTISREQILETAEDVFRRFGPAKTTVMDVARALGISHGSVYRYFDSKIALRNAVVEIWLQRFSGKLEKAGAMPGPARQRLRFWFDTLRGLKTAEYRRETELFATYHELVQDSQPVVSAYYDVLIFQLENIITAGIDSGEFQNCDPRTTACAMLDATTLFHHPWHAAAWHGKDIDDEFERVWTLIMNGLLRA